MTKYVVVIEVNEGLLDGYNPVDSINEQMEDLRNVGIRIAEISTESELQKTIKHYEAFIEWLDSQYEYKNLYQEYGYSK